MAPHLGGALRRAQDAGASTSVDSNWNPAEVWSGVMALLHHTSVLFPNTAELLALTGESDVDAGAARVVATGCRVALKNGADGGILWGPSGFRTSVATPATEVVDTTGAGDSFDAGFVSAMLDGLSDQECLERAVRCGSLSTRSVGGTAAQATRSDLL